VRIGDRTFVDGGIADPLPVDLVKEMGAERIIAVNTIPTPAYLRCCRELEREQRERNGQGNIILRTLNKHLNYFARGNVLDVMMRAVHGAQIRVAEDSCRRADIVLRPLAIDARWYEFDNPGKYIALGRRVAEERIDEIKSLIRQPTKLNEHESADHPMAGVA
jgi:NTE family protein